jgi:hypothetical protein
MAFSFTAVANSDNQPLAHHNRRISTTLEVSGNFSPRHWLNYRAKRLKLLGEPYTDSRPFGFTRP